LKNDSPEVEGPENSAQNHKVEAVQFIVESILHDAQSRLSFRAQEYIQSEIRQFKPREKELMVLARGPDLPQPTIVTSTTNVTDFLNEPSPILPRRKSSVIMSPLAEAAFIKPINSEDLKPTNSEDLTSVFGGGEWYPTLQRTVTLLAKIHSSLPVSSHFNQYLSSRMPALLI
jgi:predicted AAA+ superfamily ATPase